MQLADRSTIDHSASAGGALPFSASNQKVFLRLKQALRLNLRRQIFLAVCDDLALRNRLAAQLYAELAYPTQTATPSLSSSVSGSRAAVTNDGIRTDSLTVRQSLVVAYPHLVSLNLNLSDPNPLVQTAHWLAQYPPPRTIHHQCHPPNFQILGVERLTRQTATVQRQFLNALQQIEDYLPDLESALLLWLPRPWLHAVQQSAPTFWNWRTALFEFAGDPTPVPISTFHARTAPPTPATSPPAGQPTQRREEATPPSTAPSIETAPVPPTAPPSPTPSPNGVPATGRNRPPTLPTTPAKGNHAAPIANSATEAAIAPNARPNQSDTKQFQDELWAMLTQDLAQLQAQPTSEVLPNLAQPVEPSLGDRPQVAPTTPQNPASAQPTRPTVQPDSPPVNSTSPPPPFYQTHTAKDLAELVLAVVWESQTAIPVAEHAVLLETLDEIEQLQTEDGGEALAAAYQRLGDLYRDRVEQGDAADETLMIAICAYEQVLPWLDENSPLWADVLNEIGNLYWILAHRAPDRDQAKFHLERAIAAYQWGLTHAHPGVSPQNYAMIQNNLGSAYGDLAHYQSPVDSLAKSVQAYTEALRYRSPHADPARYAATQNNLGTAYWNLAQHHQPVHCLQRAIAAYSEALNYYSPQCEPLYYAMIQNNLGTAYWNLAQHKQAAPDEVDQVTARTANQNNDTATQGGTRQAHSISAPISPADWLQRAIGAYHAALQFRTLAVAPAAHAATQNNLGTAHWHLANLAGMPATARHQHLQQAIAAYQAALTAVHQLLNAGQPPALTFDPAATHNNLGLACQQFAGDKLSQTDGTDRHAYLERALQHHLRALHAWQHNPDFYQTAFNYLLQTIRTIYQEFGSEGQNVALTKLPPTLLPEVMKRL